MHASITVVLLYRLHHVLMSVPVSTRCRVDPVFKCLSVERSDLHLGELQRVAVAFPAVPDDTFRIHVTGDRTEQIETS